MPTRVSTYGPGRVWFAEPGTGFRLEGETFTGGGWTSLGAAALEVAVSVSTSPPAESPPVRDVRVSTYLPAGVADEMPRLGFAGPAPADPRAGQRARLVAFEVFGADGEARVLFVRRAVYRRVLRGARAGRGLVRVEFKALGGGEQMEWGS